MAETVVPMYYGGTQCQRSAPAGLTGHAGLIGLVGCTNLVKIGIIDAMSDLISTDCANFCIWSRSQRACKAQIV